MSVLLIGTLDTKGHEYAFLRAIGLFNAVPPQVDVQLRIHHLGGLQALDAVEAVCGPLPALLVSGDTAPDRLREARSAGRRLIHKPLAFEDLKQELEAAQAAKLMSIDIQRWKALVKAANLKLE